MKEFKFAPFTNKDAEIIEVETRDDECSNVLKIVKITLIVLGVVAAVAAICLVLYKFLKKYFVINIDPDEDEDYFAAYDIPDDDDFAPKCDLDNDND